jgi:hypothetical protein
VVRACLCSSQPMRMHLLFYIMSLCPSLPGSQPVREVACWCTTPLNKRMHMHIPACRIAFPNTLKEPADRCHKAWQAHR